MAQYVYTSDKAALIEEAKDILDCPKIPDCIKKRVKPVLKMLETGMSAAQLSKNCKFSGRTLSSMRKKFDKIGLEAFCPKPHKVPSRLSEEQEASLKGIILKGAPTKYGFNFWCGKSLSLVINLVFGIILGVRQCQNLFHKLGFSFIRPTTIPKKAEKFKKERAEFRKKIKELRKDPNNILVFMDEVHFKLGTSVKKSWFIKGSNPHVKANVEKGKLLYCGFINPLTDELLTYECASH